MPEWAYLANVKQDEQVIEGSRNTLQCLYDSWQKLAEYEDKIEVGDLIKVVRCKDCKWLVTSEKTNRLFCGWHSDGDMQLQIFENDYCNEGERRWPMTYEEFLETLRGCDTIIFRLTGLGEQEYMTKDLQDVAIAVSKEIADPPMVEGFGHYEAIETRYYCGSCGKRVDQNYDYCGVCGQRIDWR